jgi:hypothetical protein
MQKHIFDITGKNYSQIVTAIEDSFHSNFSGVKKGNMKACGNSSSIIEGETQKLELSFYSIEEAKRDNQNKAPFAININAAKTIIQGVIDRTN